MFISLYLIGLDCLLVGRFITFMKIQYQSAGCFGYTP